MSPYEPQGKDTRTETLTLDGEEVKFSPGETIYEISQRHQKAVPTLCYDERLEAFGACRLCVVEIDGYRNPVASCTTKAVAGMVVKTQTSGLEKHRKTLMELVVSENPKGADIDPMRGLASQEMALLANRYDVDGSRFTGKQSGRSRDDDPNPMIKRDYDHCISCYRCVRVCAEQEGDHAISVMGRGFATQITTEFEGLLRDSSCTFCGQCVQTCPTGALADRKALRFAVAPGEIEKTRTICPYCGVGCSVDALTKKDTLVGVQPAMDGPANLGALCVKGQYAWDFVQHPDRLDAPLVRGDDGALHETDWDTALDWAADGFRRVVAEFGRDSLYAVASGRAPNEAAYTVQKFVRAGWGVNGVDNCSRA
jgi:formate dehydrogenase alpha subunit